MCCIEQVTYLSCCRDDSVLCGQCCEWWFGYDAHVELWKRKPPFALYIILEHST